MGDLFAVYLGTVCIVSLKGLADDGIEGFEKHGDVVEGRDGVGDDVLETFDWVLVFAGLAHEVGIHAAGHRGILESGFGDHDLDGEGYSGEVEISADDLLADYFYHLLADGPDFVDLQLVVAGLAALRVGCFMAVLVVVGEKPVWAEGYLKADTI